MLVVLQTMLTGRYDTTACDTSLLIVDEAHHISAAAFSQVMFGLASPYVLGLTATPERRDGLGYVLNMFVGPPSYALARPLVVQVAVAMHTYVSTKEITLPTNRRGDLDYTSLVSMLVDDAERTAFIAGLVVNLAHQGRQILVLSHRREHCKTLAAMLVRDGVDAAAYLGGASISEPPSTQVIVATYSLASEGMDIPRLNALVLATPASDVVQACGRVLPDRLLTPCCIQVLI